MKHFVFLKTFLFISFLFLSCGGPEPETSSDQPSTGDLPPVVPPVIPQVPIISADEIDDLWGDDGSPSPSVPPSWGGPPSFTVTTRSQTQRNTPEANSGRQPAPTGSEARAERATGRETGRPEGGQRRVAAANQNPSNAGVGTSSSRQQVPWKGIKTTYYCRLALGPRTYITYEPGRLDPSIACEFDAVQPWRGQCQQRLSQQGWRIYDPDEECDHPVDFIDCNAAWQVLQINPSRICEVTDRVEYNSDEENPLISSDRSTIQQGGQQQIQGQSRVAPAATTTGESGVVEGQVRVEPRWSTEESSAPAPHSPLVEDDVF